LGTTDLDCNRDVTQSGASAKIFPGGQRRHFACPFSGCHRCNANGLSRNALSFLHNGENSSWKHALHSYYFKNVVIWIYIRVCEKVVFFVILYSFCWIGVSVAYEAGERRGR